MDSHLVSVDLLPHVRYWPLADICFAPTNACSGGKGDVIVDGPPKADIWFYLALELQRERVALNSIFNTCSPSS